MTGRESAIVLAVALGCALYVACTDDAAAPQTSIAAAVLADGTLEPLPCQTALYGCGATLEWERELYDRCERYAPQTIEALRATVDAQATRLHRTPYAAETNEPTATTRPVSTLPSIPGWGTLPDTEYVPMAVRSW